jgi:phosphatidylglycerol:prolipoprotein diacylglycerol transferase
VYEGGFTVDVNFVRFPGLGLGFEIRRHAFTVFNIEIYWYGIIIALAFLTAVLLAIKSCKKHDLTPDHILDLVLYAAPVSIVSARLFYVVFSWDQYKDDLLGIFRIRDGGLAIYGGVIGALLVAWLYTKKKKISFFHLADFGIPYLLLGQGIGRWGNFTNQEAFGTVTNLPWRMNGSVPDAYIMRVMPEADLSVWGVHPTFLYESLWDIAAFLFLLFYRKRKKADGEVLCLYLILYGVGRAFIEGLRTDSLYLGDFRVSQLLSIILVFIGIVLFIYGRLRAKKAAVEEPVELGRSKYGELLMRMKEEEEAEAGSTGGNAEEAETDGTELCADPGTCEEKTGDEDESTESDIDNNTDVTDQQNEPKCNQ